MEHGEDKHDEASPWKVRGTREGLKQLPQSDPESRSSSSRDALGNSNLGSQFEQFLEGWEAHFFFNRPKRWYKNTWVHTPLYEGGARGVLKRCHDKEKHKGYQGGVCALVSSRGWCVSRDRIRGLSAKKDQVEGAGEPYEGGGEMSKEGGGGLCGECIPDPGAACQTDESCEAFELARLQQCRGRGGR